MQTSHRAVFVHGGPGFTCEVERRWFGDSLPVNWWDQPKYTEGDRSWFAKATEALGRVVAEATIAARQPISVVAHSHGALLAREVAESHPERIRDLVLLSPGVSLPDQLVRVGRYLLAGRSDAESASLSVAVAAAVAGPSAGSMLQLAGVIANCPEWRRAYFSTGSAAAYQRFLQLLPDGAFVDFPTYAAGVGEHIATPPTDRVSRFRGSVRALIGREDVSLNTQTVVPFWQRVFPRVEVELVPAGHMIQFEVPPSVWMPATN